MRYCRWRKAQFHCHCCGQHQSLRRRERSDYLPGLLIEADYIRYCFIEYAIRESLRAKVV